MNARIKTNTINSEPMDVFTNDDDLEMILHFLVFGLTFRMLLIGQTEHLYKIVIKCIATDVLVTSPAPVMDLVSPDSAAGPAQCDGPPVTTPCAGRACTYDCSIYRCRLSIFYWVRSQTRFERLGRIQRSHDHAMNPWTTTYNNTAFFFYLSW